jgi:cell division protein FtsL
MASGNRGLVWSLITAIIVLLLGLMGLLYVSYSRDQQYQSEIQDLRYKLTEKHNQLELLRNQLPQRPVVPDTSWGVSADTALH